MNDLEQVEFTRKRLMNTDIHMDNYGVMYLEEGDGLVEIAKFSNWHYGRVVSDMLREYKNARTN